VSEPDVAALAREHGRPTSTVSADLDGPLRERLAVLEGTLSATHLSDRMVRSQALGAVRCLLLRADLGLYAGRHG
jgi:hypothetical protein